MATVTPLYGGLVNRVVRVGDTVRRPAGPWTRAVQALLGHLETKGFPAPRPGGIDQDGREVISYIEGEAALVPWPRILAECRGMTIIGRALRAYHEAVSDFVVPPEAHWQIVDRPFLPGEIVCHGDLNPSNFIWRGERLAGIIDWELAHPGRALDDLAHAAWSFVPLCSDEALGQLGPVVDRRERLAALVAGYGDVQVFELVDGALRVMDFWTRQIVRHGGAGEEPWATYHRHELHTRAERDHRWLYENYASLVG